MDGWLWTVLLRFLWRLCCVARERSAFFFFFLPLSTLVRKPLIRVPVHSSALHTHNRAPDKVLYRERWRAMLLLVLVCTTYIGQEMLCICKGENKRNKQH